MDRFYDEFYAKFKYADGFSGWKEKPSFYKILDGFDLSRYNKRKYPTAKSVIVDALTVFGRDKRNFNEKTKLLTR